MILATWGGGLRVVLAVYGRADDAPQTDAARNDYCTFVGQPPAPLPGRQRRRDLERAEREPLLAAAVRRDGKSVAPAAYEALLARCWDTLHAVRPGANVIAASAARGNDNPSRPATSLTRRSTSTASSAQAYRDSGRRRPILDTVGHNPYPTHEHRAAVGRATRARRRSPRATTTS